MFGSFFSYFLNVKSMETYIYRHMSYIHHLISAGSRIVDGHVKKEDNQC